MSREGTSMCDFFLFHSFELVELQRSKPQWQLYWFWCESSFTLSRRGVVPQVCGFTLLTLAFLRLLKKYPIILEYAWTVDVHSKVRFTAVGAEWRRVLASHLLVMCPSDFCAANFDRWANFRFVPQLLAVPAHDRTWSVGSWR